VPDLPVDARDAALLALAHLAALCLDRDRHRTLARDASRSLDDLERRLLGAEHRAAGGELAVEIGRELREPLTGIAGLASRVAESLEPDDSRRSLLERVVEEAGAWLAWSPRRKPWRKGGPRTWSRTPSTGS